MALKGDRVILETDISMNCMTVAVRGQCLAYLTTGSGAALGDTASTAQVAANPSGLMPLGTVLHDVVVVDQTRFHRNFQNGQQLVGERCTAVRKGYVVTDQILPGIAPTLGDTAYLAASGLYTNAVNVNGGLVATPKVGQFKGQKDADGFVKIDIHLPA